MITNIFRQSSESLLYATFFSKHITCINALNPPNHSIILWFCTHFREVETDSQRLSNFTKDSW